MKHRITVRLEGEFFNDVKAFAEREGRTVPNALFRLASLALETEKNEDENELPGESPRWTF